MEVLSVIPARGGSKGIPMKNLVILNKKPLLYYTIKASLNSVINRTVVSTDNKKIASKAKQFGAEVVYRPKNLSNDTIQIEPIIAHTLDYLKEKEGYVPDIVILLQNTSPLRTSTHINEALSLFKRGRYDSVFSGFNSHYLLWKRSENTTLPVNYNPFKRPNRQEMKGQFIENGAIYITKYQFFKKNNCRMSGKIGVYEMPQKFSVQIDTRDDLMFAEMILRRVR